MNPLYKKTLDQKFFECLRHLSTVRRHKPPWLSSMMGGHPSPLGEGSGCLPQVRRGVHPCRCQCCCPRCLCLDAEPLRVALACCSTQRQDTQLAQSPPAMASHLCIKALSASAIDTVLAILPPQNHDRNHKPMPWKLSLTTSNYLPTPTNPSLLPPPSSSTLHQRPSRMEKITSQYFGHHLLHRRLPSIPKNLIKSCLGLPQGVVAL